MFRESELTRIHQDLMTGTWRPSSYRFFTIHEPKRREIAAAPFGDRVVHHALCRWMGPLLERRFIARSFSCQIGKGTSAARASCRSLVNRYRWVLKCDVRKFFPSLDHEILGNRLDEEIACPGVRRLIRLLLASFQTPVGQLQEWYPGDELFGAGRAKGVPIGNLTSQLWGNFYLDPLDHWMVEEEQHGAYVRYTDDFLVFADSKARLWELHSGIEAQLGAMRLRLSVPKSRLLACAEGVPFCGFRFLPERSPRILGATKRRFERRRRVFSRLGDYQRLGETVRARYQFSLEANSTGLRRAWARRRRVTNWRPRPRG